MSELRCADVARQRDDALYASAPCAQQWLLLEHLGPWGRHILTDSGLACEVAGELERWARQTSGRVLLIRRPGSDRRARTGRRWYWADSRSGAEQVRWGTFDDEAEIVDMLRDPTAGQACDEPIYLVCTHGKRDVCCALRGRPVAAALASEYPQRTWECSHVGGDRFAANLVLLPHGFYFGHVPPESATELVRIYDKGLLGLRWLRGRSSLLPPVQAAQHFVRTATGEAGVDSYPPLSCEDSGSDQWTVRLAVPADQPRTVVVQARVQLTPEPLSCALMGTGWLRDFELVSGADRPEHLSGYAFGPPAT
ncbi:MAG: sucrase ferredoxin [Pseudonocardiales bacterium]